MKTNGFLNPVEIRRLINANTDEHAPHFVFMTIYGTIFGHDKNNNTSFVRKFGAFAGTTWLRHAKAIAETGAASTEPDFGLNGKTLKVIISKDGKGLHHMLVEVDNIISAIYYVKEKTLLAAQMEREKFAEETDEISAKFRNSDLANGGETVGAKAGVTATTDAQLKAKDPENAKGQERSEPEAYDTDRRGTGNDATASSSVPPTSPLSKIRILEIRAEAMAEAFVEEICGPSFKMPAEFR